MSTHTNSSLSDFEGESQSQASTSERVTPEEESIPLPDYRSETTEETIVEGKVFTAPPEPYPTEEISTRSTNERSGQFCVAGDETVDALMRQIGGKGGFGGKVEVDHQELTYEILSQLIGGPILRYGGGSFSLEPNYVFGRLVSVEKTSESIKVEIDELYTNKTLSSLRDEPRSTTLGSWMVAVPATESDYNSIAAALTDWETGTTNFFNPSNKATHNKSAEAIERFRQLSVADKLEIPTYKSRLEVISEKFETHAIVRRGTLRNRTHEVLAVTVSNPKGGYYQIGLKIPSDGPYEDIPTCYISRSNNSPPTPNTAFTVDETFNATEIERTKIPNPPNPTIIEPDKEVLESPLPEPSLQSSLTNIEYVGEKTRRKIWQAVDEHLSMEQLAYELYGNGTLLSQDDQEKAKGILSKLPRKKSIINTLKSEAEKYD